MTRRMSAKDFQAKFGPRYKPGLALKHKPVASQGADNISPVCLWVPMRAPGLSDLINKHWGKVAKIKKQWRDAIAATRAGASYYATADDKYKVALTIYEPNKRRDQDNVIGGAKKCILDALVGNYYLWDDDRKHVEDGGATIVYGDIEGVQITLELVG